MSRSGRLLHTFVSRTHLGQDGDEVDMPVTSLLQVLTINDIGRVRSGDLDKGLVELCIGSDVYISSLWPNPQPVRPSRRP